MQWVRSCECTINGAAVLGGAVNSAQRNSKPQITVMNNLVPFFRVLCERGHEQAYARYARKAAGRKPAIITLPAKATGESSFGRVKGSLHQVRRTTLRSRNNWVKSLYNRPD